MRVVSTKFRLASTILAFATLAIFSGNAAAQSVADNIRPVGQVCVAGQPCVGSPAGGATTVVDPSPAATTQVEEEPVVEQAVSEPEVETPAVVAATSADTGFDVAGQYQMSCFACHASGAAGAPLLGDTEAWDSRLEKGMDAVMTNVINGINAMPAKGLCMNCTDDNLRAIVDYMIAQ